MGCQGGRPWHHGVAADLEMNHAANRLGRSADAISKSFLAGEH
jgi:hypothetical protein